MAETENQREFHRGEIYMTLSGDTTSSVEFFKRPCMVISSERGCQTSPILNVVALTTKQKFGVINVPLGGLYRDNWAMCNQIFTIAKTQCLERMGVATEQEMAEVDRALKMILGLRENLPEEDNEAESEVENLKSEILAQKLETALYQKLYEKAMDQLVSTKFDVDLHSKQSVSAPVAKPKVEVYDPGFEPVDVNRCDVADLQCIGVSAPVAKQIIAGRPYMTVEDLLIVPGMTKVGYGLISKKVTVGDTGEFVKKKQPKPKVEGKVNVNTATAGEIVEKTGISSKTAELIVAYRKKNGRVEKREDLLNITRFGNGCLKKYGPMMEV